MLQARSCFRPAELHCALRQVSGGHVERITSPQCTQLALGKVGRRNLPKTKPATKDLQRPDRLRPPSLEGASLKQKITLLHAGTAIECKTGRLPRGARALVVTNLARGETHERTPRFGGYLMSTRANSLLYLVLRYRGPARVDGDTLARRRQNKRLLFGKF